MRITKNQLKQIIKEELAGVLKEEITTDMPTKDKARLNLDWKGTNSQDAVDDYTADWTGKREMYAQDPSTRPQGIEKYLAKAAHRQGLLYSNVESGINAIMNIPNALHDAAEVMDMAYTGGVQKNRLGDATALSNKRVESGDWTKEQAAQFRDGIGRMSMGPAGSSATPELGGPLYAERPLLPQVKPPAEVKESRRRKVRKTRKK